MHVHEWGCNFVAGWWGPDSSWETTMPSSLCHALCKLCSCTMLSAVFCETSACVMPLQTLRLHGILALIAGPAAHIPLVPPMEGL